ncbi:MAG TPA: hypothetical protein VEG43_03545 [Dehalococcoidia bacterium]|nr:hypothetical protein [Dehalococcoidia bacterium]
MERYKPERNKADEQGRPRQANLGAQEYAGDPGTANIEKPHM